MEYIRWNVLALNDELHEALAETGWKPWASSNHFNRVEYTRELVDALHFLLNLMLVAGYEPHEIVSMYLYKSQKNARRQENGYDGIQDKCPSCRREVDGPDETYQRQGPADVTNYFCNICFCQLDPRLMSWMGADTVS
jgi:hypothetical protein